MEIDTIDVAYTIGGATVSLSQSETTNASYTAGDEVVETFCHCQWRSNYLIR